MVQPGTCVHGRADTGSMGLKGILLGMGWLALALMGATTAVGYLRTGSVGSAAPVILCCFAVAMVFCSTFDRGARTLERVRVRRRLARNVGTVVDLLTFLDARAYGKHRWWHGAPRAAEAHLVLPVVVRWVEGRWNPEGTAWWRRWQGPYRDVPEPEVGAVYRWLTTTARGRSVPDAPVSLLVDCLDARVSGPAMVAHLDDTRPLDAEAVAVVASLRRPLPC